MALGFYIALKSTGIVDISFDPNKGIEGSLTINAKTPAGTQTNWLAASKDNIYAISRLDYPDESSESGGIFAYRKSDTSNDASLTLLNDQKSNGKGGVHCEVSPDGTMLAAANINGAVVSIYPILEDGRTGDPTQVFDYNGQEPELKAKQISPSPHEVKFDPTGQFLFVPQRSADNVYVYSVQSPQEVKLNQKITLPPGTGPRHTAFRAASPTKSYMYLISENDNMVRAFTLDYGSASGSGSPALTITLQQAISTLGKDRERSPPDHVDLAAEIAVSNDGRFLYASNRHIKSMDNDNIAIYSIDDKNFLTYLESKDIAGKFPRTFALSNDKDNRWVAVAHELTQSIVVFERDVETGLLKGIKGRISLGENDRTLKKGPVCILWKS